MFRTITALTAATAAAFLVAPTAGAGESCPNDTICMWEDSGYTGTRYIQVELRPGDGARIYEIDWWHGDNEISSVINNTGCEFTLRATDLGVEVSGAGLWRLGARSQYGDLNQVFNFSRASANDDAESFILWC
ncbi:peptidase inhibitor family I36 protein [Allokutzneria sp. NRRL B-24872]|uniref:peptidase inhibitor family I36 protein n=1 Tax=Allokutzneria sp. NRRL B-24872 TaxID=1137961 RepID=UPI000A3B57BE|nr:peptidase inhibitor family I36 protein [Allokutzneria sp. NRRL B-24872]